MYYDRNMRFLNERGFWLGIIFLLFGGMYAKNVFIRE